MTEYRRYVSGQPINHPPIPESWDKSTSSSRTPRIDTGNNPGPGSEGPLDPRLHNPRVINSARAVGSGCSSCQWNGQCKIFYYQRNFGFIDRENNGGVTSLNPKLGIACESWNVDFAPLHPSAYNQDGIGLGDPYSDGRAGEEGVFDPFSYAGQYNDILWRFPWSWTSVND